MEAVNNKVVILLSAKSISIMRYYLAMQKENIKRRVRGGIAEFAKG